MRLRFTPKAIEDISELSDYIAGNLSNPTAALRIKESLLRTCSLLKTQPYMGGSVAEKTGYETELRFFVCEKHYIVYLVEEDVISVARVINGRQDFIRILFGELGE